MNVVLLPGLLCDESVWLDQIAALRPHCTVHVADFSQASSIEAMAEAALQMVAGPIVAIGHSMGARVALDMLRLAPDRITHLGLIDTGVHPRRDGEADTRQVLVDLAHAEGMAALAARWLPPMVHPDRTHDEALLAPLRAMVARATPAQHERQIRALLGRRDAEPLLGTIACPTLVMVGRQDRWSPLAQHEAIAKAIPRAELVVIEDSGHMSLVEQPDSVSQALLAWLGFDARDTIPDTPLFDRPRSLRGYRINKMAMALGDAANRDAFRQDEGAFLDRFGLDAEQKQAVMTRHWRDMVRLGGNLFYILKITAIDPVRITEVGAHQAGMAHDAFLRVRLGKTL